MNKPPIREAQATTHPQTAPAENLLRDARQALEAGDREGAYRKSLEATQQEQGNKDAWLIRAQTAASREEKLLCLSQAVRIDPNHPNAKHALYTNLKSELEQDPFLAYVDETGELYFVRDEQYLSLAVPKDRNIPESYPPERPEALTKAYRWLGWSVLGLALAGLGTLILAPLAFSQAASTSVQRLDKPDRVRARLAFWLSFLLSAISLSLVALLVVHFLG